MRTSVTHCYTSHKQLFGGDLPFMFCFYIHKIIICAPVKSFKVDSISSQFMTRSVVIFPPFPPVLLPIHHCIGLHTLSVCVRLYCVCKLCCCVCVCCTGTLSGYVLFYFFFVVCGSVTSSNSAFHVYIWCSCFFFPFYFCCFQCLSMFLLLFFFSFMVRITG